MSTSQHSHTAVMSNRLHDYLYDTNYTVAGKTDHVREINRAQAQQVVINPHFENMFSALRHYPPVEYRIKTQPLLPGIGQDRRIDAAHSYIAGADRFKYFKRPIMPYIPSLGGQIVYARRPKSAEDDAVSRPSSPYSKTIGTQTLYRESEAQTDPYSPEYLLRPNLPPPELLALATLTYGAGLPVGMAELEMIERARAKRAWEATLPLVVNQETFERRLKMMEEMELKEWQERELEIKRLQEARLKVLAAVIQKREEETESVDNERIEHIWQRKLQEREATFERINRKRIKEIRKLTEKRSQVEYKIGKRDIIADYAGYESRIYAQKARCGAFTGKASSALCIEIDELESYHGLEELERTFSPLIFQEKIKLPKWKKSAKSPALRRERHIQDQLETMSLKFQEQKTKGETADRHVKYAIKIEKPQQRPPTPSIRIPSEEDEEMEVAAILLQKNFTRAYYARYDVPSSRTTEREQSAMSNQNQIRQFGEDLAFDLAVQNNDMETTRPNVCSETEQLGRMFESTIQSEYVGKSLDFLTKELVRLREERRISAMVMLAERTRRIREAEESGRRQMEMRRRGQEDEIFRQVMQVHQETVQTYLQDIVSGCVDTTANEQARAQVQECAIKIDQISKILVDRDIESGGQNLVEDLVSSFLLPHVENQILQNQGEKEIEIFETDKKKEGEDSQDFNLSNIIKNTAINCVDSQASEYENDLPSASIDTKLPEQEPI
ncbi:hypothetical protein BASA60_006225 [Batrachochytrium salamandrivorans]|nr:hypothetical protein BASA60_006225 [Batrachochytrium salamandrivorans]